MDRLQDELSGAVTMTPDVRATSTERPKPHVIVVGAGWAGLAAAIELTDLGANVTVLERARQPGGRARALPATHNASPANFKLDNGQHILLGAYHTCLQLLRRVGVDPDDALLRLPLQQRYADGWGLIARPGGRPWHVLAGLWEARGLSWSERLSLVRKLSMSALRGWRCDTHLTVAQWLVNETPRAVERLWQPLCVSALNTPIEEASAQVFLNVLRDALLSGAGSSDMLIPRVDFGTLFADPAMAWLAQHGSCVKLGQPAHSLAPSATGWAVETPSGTLPADGVVIATAPRNALQLLEHQQLNASANLQTLSAQLSAFTYAPITTVYLPDPGIRLPFPMLALRCAPENKAYGQFLFDRGRLQSDGSHWAVVISAADAALQHSREKLAELVCQQLIREIRLLLPDVDLAMQLRPEDALVVTEKQATFRCRPALSRPDHVTGMRGLTLAGDYTSSMYPATLESAARSGVGAAHALWKQLR